MGKSEKQMMLEGAKIILEDSKSKIPRLNDGVKYGAIASACLVASAFCSNLGGIFASIGSIFVFVYIGMIVFTIKKGGLSEFKMVCARLFSAVLRIPLPLINLLIALQFVMLVAGSVIILPVVYYGVARILVARDIDEAKIIIAQTSGKNYKDIK